MAITATTTRSAIAQTSTVAKASEPKAKTSDARAPVGPSVVVSVGRGQAQTSGTYGANGRVASSNESAAKQAPVAHKSAAPPTTSAKQPEVKATPEPARKVEPKPVAKKPEPAVVVKKPEVKAAPQPQVKATPEHAKHAEPQPVAKTPEPIVSPKKVEAQSAATTATTQGV